MTQLIGVSSRAAVTVRPAVLQRAEWPNAAQIASDGRIGRSFSPRKGTWYPYVARGSKAHDVSVVPLISCPLCAGILIISHTEGTAKEASRLIGRPVEVVHTIDPVGKISPDIRCMHGKCSFHRTVYLDRWNKTKPLYAISYTRKGSLSLEFSYCHATDQREALFHLGGRPGDFAVVAVAPCVGYFVADEQKGTLVT